jgi:hypothetical protein
LLAVVTEVVVVIAMLIVFRRQKWI